MITPAVRPPGLTWITSDEHGPRSLLIGTIVPLKYHPPSTPLALSLVLLGPSPVRQRAIRSSLPGALMYESVRAPARDELPLVTATPTVIITGVVQMSLCYNIIMRNIS